MQIHIFTTFLPNNFILRILKNWNSICLGLTMFPIWGYIYYTNTCQSLRAILNLQLNMDMIWTVSTYYGTETKEHPKGLPFAEALDEIIIMICPKAVFIYQIVNRTHICLHLQYNKTSLSCLWTIFSLNPNKIGRHTKPTHF